MTHFNAHSAGIQFFNGLFHSGTDIAAHALPVLFLQSLGNGKVLNGFFFARRLYPEFKFSAGCKYDILDFREREVFHSLDLCIGKKLLELFGYIFTGFLQYGSGINELAVMDQEAWNTQRSDRAAVFIGNIFIIVINVPVDGAVSDHVDSGIIECCNVHEYNGGSIGLHSFSCEEVLIIFHKNFNRNFLIGIVACQINSYQRYESDFRMLCQQGQNSFFSILTSGDAVQQFFVHLSPPEKLSTIFVFPDCALIKIK